MLKNISRKRVSVLIITIVFITAGISLVQARTTQFLSGETLNPNCSPTEVNCSIDNKITTLSLKKSDVNLKDSRSAIRIHNPGITG